MALTKIKVNEVGTKANPVAGDYSLASDSENDGKLILIPFDGIPLPSNALTIDTAQEITAIKTFRVPFQNMPTGTANYNAFSIGAAGVLTWYLQYKPSTKELNWFTTKGGLFPIPLSLVYDPDPRAVFPIAPHVTTEAQTDNSLKAASTAFVQAATANAIYDLPVTRTGLVSPGTDSIIFETDNAIDAAWYDTTHVLNVSFFADRNYPELDIDTTFKFQLYDEGTSTAHTIASITADIKDYRLLQASIYRPDSSSVNCNIQYGVVSGSGNVSLAAGSYKLRVVCTSTLATVFGAAQVRFTK